MSVRIVSNYNDDVETNSIKLGNGIISKQFESNNWRELENYSLLLRGQNKLEEADLFYRKAESLFFEKHPQINSKDLLFLEINWIEYVDFFTDFREAKYTKLKAIRHLYTYGIAGGRLGEYLIAKEEVEKAITFFHQKIFKSPKRKLFSLGYVKLLNQLTSLVENPPPSLDSLSLNRSLLLFQRQLIKENLSLKEQLSKSENSSPSPDYITKYKSKLRQAERESAADIFKIKSLNSHKYPEVGKISSNNSAIVGKQGWLYISSGTNHLMEYHIGHRKLPLLKVKQWRKLLSSRIRWHEDQKIKYQHVFIPNKIAVYPEYYPHKLDIRNSRPIVQLKQGYAKLFSYPLDVLSQYKKNFRLYEKQDCHWSFWGCYFTYKLLCQKFGITPNFELLDFPIEILQVKGDLGAKFGLTDRILRPNLKFNSQIIHDNQVINYCKQGSIRVLKNPKISHGKMIIFGDSFSNPAKPNFKRQSRLVGRLSSLFAETINEVHFVWTPWIDYDYIKQEKPDFVLTEMAERFLVRAPDDLDHLPLHEFAMNKIAQSKVKISSEAKLKYSHH